MSQNPSTNSSIETSKGASSIPQDWGFSRPLLRNPWFYFTVLMVSFVTFSRPLFRHFGETLPILRVIPEFSFLNEQGVPMGSQDLRGKPYVASFVFSRCTSSCPLIIGHLVELQKQFLDGGLPIKLVTFTVDPEFDRPSVLNDFALRVNAKSDRWNFLTSSEPASGQSTKVQNESFISFIENSFGAGIGKPEKSETELGQTAMDIAHSEKLLLIDAKGRLRGYFPASAEGVNEIFDRALALFRERNQKEDGLASRVE